MLDINEMTFGCEFELTIPAGTIQVGGYHNGRSIPGFPPGWNAQSDGSIAVSIPGHVGAEIVSPILRGADGLQQIKDVLARLNAMGARVNRSCGFHVHVGFPTQVVDKLGNLVYLVSNLEKAFYASTGTKNRERNQYCRSVKCHSVRNLNWDAVERTRNARNMGSRSHFDRFHVLNLNNIQAGTRKAVEFRVFAGTLNLSKVVGHIRMCLAIVQKATDSRRRVTWDAAQSAGATVTGKAELHRFFYRMGWHAGGTTNGRVYGELLADGIPGIEDSKTILNKMASKYDAAEAAVVSPAF